MFSVNPVTLAVIIDVVAKQFRISSVHYWASANSYWNGFVTLKRHQSSSSSPSVFVAMIAIPPSAKLSLKSAVVEVGAGVSFLCSFVTSVHSSASIHRQTHFTLRTSSAKRRVQFLLEPQHQQFQRMLWLHPHLNLDTFSRVVRYAESE